MIPRYIRPEMAEIWSLESKFRAWLDVEIAVCEVLAEKGEIPAEALAAIKEKADFSVERILEIEKITRHDVIAFTTAVAESVGPESRFIHMGLTSTDVCDTAQALLVKRASNLIQTEIESFLDTLKEQAYRYKDTVMTGRPHGVHAEPTSFGLKIAVWSNGRSGIRKGSGTWSVSRTPEKTWRSAKSAGLWAHSPIYRRMWRRGYAQNSVSASPPHRHRLSSVIDTLSISVRWPYWVRPMTRLQLRSGTSKERR